MKVKVGDTIYDSVPIMVILSPQDKINIANMAPEATKYAICPKDWSDQEIRDWMNTEKNSE